jgi:hypothetical protein
MLIDIMDTSNQNDQLYIPNGILTAFCELVNVDKSVGTQILYKRITELVNLYSSNGMQAFWTESDLNVLHVIISNHLLSRLDTDEAIKDVELYESVYSKLEMNFVKWVSETKRVAFNDSIINVLNTLSPNALQALVVALSVSLTLLDEPIDGSAIKTGDDKALWQVVQNAKTAETKPNWARIRLKLVLGMLQKEQALLSVETIGQPQPELEVTAEIEAEPTPEIEQELKEAVAPRLSLSDMIKRGGTH